MGSTIATVSAQRLVEHVKNVSQNITTEQTPQSVVWDQNCHYDRKSVVCSGLILLGQIVIIITITNIVSIVKQETNGEKEETAKENGDGDKEDKDEEKSEDKDEEKMEEEEKEKGEKDKEEKEKKEEEKEQGGNSIEKCWLEF